MPYEVVRVGNKFAVKTKTTGKLHGLTSLPNARSQLRILELVKKKSGK